MPVDAFYPDHSLDFLHVQDQSFYPDHPLDIAISPEGWIAISIIEGRLLQVRPSTFEYHLQP